MLLLGLLIVAAAVAFSTVVIADNLGGGPHYSVGLFGHHLGTVNTLGAFLAGIALALLLCLGLLVATAGARRERRRNAELRTARRERKAATKAAAKAGAGSGGDTVVDGEDTLSSRPLLAKRTRTPHLFSR
jgi:hypothetical protein